MIMNEGEKVANGLPPYDRSEEWHNTLIELQAHILERKAQQESGVDDPRSVKEIEVRDSLIPSSLHKLAMLVTSPDAKRRLDHWADTLLNESEDKRQLILAALEKSLPLLLDAPQQYVVYIIAAAAASISEEGHSDTQVDAVDTIITTQAVPERLQVDAVPISHSAETLDLPPTQILHVETSSSTTTLPDTSSAERAWTRTANSLQRKLKKAEKSKGKGSGVDARDIINTMLKLASLHSDPLVRNEITDHAKRLENANDQERENMFKDLVKGIGLITATPFALAGAAVFAAGAIIYGSGKIIIGIGQVLTLGKLRRK